MSSHPYVEDASTKISPKVTAAGVAASVTMVLLWLLGQVPFVAGLDTSITTPLFGLITSAVTAIAAYVVPDAARYVENHIPASVGDYINISDFDLDAWLKHAAETITHETAQAVIEAVPAGVNAKVDPSVLTDVPDEACAADPA